MEEERKLGKNILKKYIDKKCADSIEKNLYNYSKQSKTVYMDKLKYIFEIINPKSQEYNKQIIQDIKKKKITPYDLINNKPWELYKEQWKDFVEEQNKNDKIVIDKTAEFTTTQFTCSKCKNNECKTYSLQTRSADETYNNFFVNCIKCNNTWKMSKK